ncbi:endonuclease/exonuclease/phosphatase family protein [Sphingomonas sanguinis]|uniref:Endonuclease/exonuclease/phosphatase family protein n=2 Tax=Sphingomonas sanguinis TaxID=33051 RepID=A0A7Y7QYN6_9SPHN|nr:endonuclease/exonuclease/phosphatase family protein [Sphingomonas sanguinis]NNG55036.1 endonuclease/exonuclease/phosphatase family protein [Sphingomonas sanguinis]NVP32871.1 endonuclease/exonuclease/phosphatase family protein [Sphingomonas sanguinis]
MRRTIRGLAVLATGLLVATGALAEPLKVMTFNVRYASDEGAQRWAVRRPVMVELIRRAAPDVIGTQELLQRQGDDIVASLPGYRWFGRDRRGGHADEHMGIFYRTDRLTLIDQGDFWLSDTPEVVGSQSWGTDLPRLASWAVFETREAKPHRFLFVDTHLPHRDQDGEARDKAARLILSRLPDLAKGLPLVLAGDMNARPDTAAYRTFAGALTDAWGSAKRREGPVLTFHDFTGTPDRRIDYLFLRGFKADTVTTDTYHQGKVYPSDHFPIEATLTFEDETR